MLDSRKRVDHHLWLSQGSTVQLEEKLRPTPMDLHLNAIHRLPTSSEGTLSDIRSHNGMRPGSLCASFLATWDGYELLRLSLETNGLLRELEIAPSRFGIWRLVPSKLHSLVTSALSVDSQFPIATHTFSRAAKTRW